MNRCAFLTAILSIFATIIGGAVAGVAIISHGFSVTSGLFGLLAALIGAYTLGTVVGVAIGRHS